ncbi:DUF4145 domain-containing protein [Metabacillus litoralis]|uniref:DUF4145 domain-containing protein n=1 Tax=Metabacillus litoralis TaxID=152268 RepID=UPI0020405F8C|nr:DUF4145 domain-containing protein [Metabacillus litoralis]MCM3651317.1 DUF4145 domain-containing protein [Metabacillus litoralis]
MKLEASWYYNIKEISGISYLCGHCGTKTGPSKGFVSHYLSTTTPTAHVYICSTCNKPTFINNQDGQQVPGPLLGEPIDHLPEDIENLFDEARKCISVNAYTSAVLSCRKLLMNISVSKGAEAGKSFASYVTFLEENHYIPPNSREWVDHIRKKGNEATHEIPSISKEDAIELLEFTEMLLRFVYEMPGKMKKYRKD